MITHNLGYPRIGPKRELKKASESFWEGNISSADLMQAGSVIKKNNWLFQKEAGIDLIPSNDFSFYDHVLDMAVSVGAIPVRFKCLQNYMRNDEAGFYFALARGYQKDGFDITAMEMTKWFDTNYHYIVPEFTRNQKFGFLSRKIVNEFTEAKELGIITKPVLIGPVSFLLMGKAKEESFDTLDLLPELLPVYLDIIYELTAKGARWIQFDEPFLVTDINDRAREMLRIAYEEIGKEFQRLKIMLATYFDGLTENLDTAMALSIDAIHIDLVRAPDQLKTVLEKLPGNMSLSLGLVDGRNIWKNDFTNSLYLIKSAVEAAGADRIMIAPSCSLIHTPVDIDLETDENILPAGIKQWMAFSKQKIDEVVTLRELALSRIADPSDNIKLLFNSENLHSKKSSPLIHSVRVQERLGDILKLEMLSRSDFRTRKMKQRELLKLPVLPSTTIGSFPQTPEVRSWRAKMKKGDISREDYVSLVMKEIGNAIKWQEDAGLDVLVHGEFERNDMVEYFGEMLEGFAFTKNGWIQSYGSRYVKPPVIYGDVNRPRPMTVEWIKYAQSLTNKPVKGMLTGPVTILQWSFVRNDQPLSETCLQIALAIRDEVLDLEKAGIKIIQIDEPALREGLPLKRTDWKDYLDWAVRAFRLTYAGVKDETQIHTHMCYSEFSDIIEQISSLDADVLTIECSRSQMEMLDVFAGYKYPNDIGPGVYDIHSPRIPSEKEIADLLGKAASVIPEDQLWVNPDCGLKTRKWEETKRSIENMIKAVRTVRERYTVPAEK
ncbi:MAG TPA: 5-methyltetrahydropteroyltriglutamate--homocysteine S-methyltransferase [Bacteroidales bacterium]|nr:5-methyltetrahydropteroyltriglutamate--homocysteine S-methyltransferase [Bacteroidales bacterium]